MRARDWPPRLAMAVTVGIWILASTVPVGAQATREEARTALVIGNGAYRDTPLRNPVNDVRAIAKTLRHRNFLAKSFEPLPRWTGRAAIVARRQDWLPPHITIRLYVLSPDAILGHYDT